VAKDINLSDDFYSNVLISISSWPIACIYSYYISQQRGLQEENAIWYCPLWCSIRWV